MSNVTNLNRFRKAKQREEKRAAADANAVKFGRNKAERERDEATRAAETRHLDGHRLDGKPLGDPDQGPAKPR